MNILTRYRIRRDAASFLKGIRAALALALFAAAAVAAYHALPAVAMCAVCVFAGNALWPAKPEAAE